MYKTTRMLMAIAIAVALPAVAQLTDNEKKAAEQKAAEAKKAGKAAPAPATAPAPAPASAARQETVLKNTASGDRTMAAPKKMTPEEKAADKAVKRKAPTKEEEEKTKKALPGG